MPYGSMSCAKNMMIDDTGSFLTNEIGLGETFTCAEGEQIVGVIPCNTEIVIFTHNFTSGVSHIYRKKDNNAAEEVGAEGHRVNWTHTVGAKITGSYTYNYKGELIIAFSEYKDDGSLNIPLKSLNLDEFDSNQGYAIEEEIPTYDTGSSIVSNGSLLCGVYTFFIRFKVDRNNYTKWFQVSGDLNITQIALSKKYVHKYLSPNGGGNQLQTATAGVFNVNTNKISNKSVVLSITFGTSKFSTFQLGYIIKRDSAVEGRIQGEYSITSSTETKVTIANNKYIEEISVDSFLENPHQFFNVKNVTNYNNRLYIANYKEYPVVDHSAKALETTIDVSGNTGTKRETKAGTRSESEGGGNNNTNIIWSLDLKLMQHCYVRSGSWSETANINFANIITNSEGYISDPTGFINQIANYLKSKYVHTSTPDAWGSGKLNYYWFLQLPNNNSKDGAICIAKHINDERYPDAGGCWGWNLNVPEYKVKITTDSSGETPTYGIQVEYNGKVWNLLSNDNDKSTVLVFWHIDGDLQSNCWQFGNNIYTESGPSWEAWIPKEYTNNPEGYTGGYMNHDIHLSITNISNTAGENNGGDDTPIPGSGGESSSVSGANNRTLHPFQTYNFFIHYIRKDGSCTLGFPIGAEPVTYQLASGAKIIVPRFTATNPDSNEFVGYFISYEDVESTVDCVYITVCDKTNKLLIFTNAQYLYDLDTIRGTSINIDGTNYTIDQNALSYIDSRLTYNHLEIKGTEYTVTNKVAYVLKSIANIYNNKTKVLYRLTKNIYDFTEKTGTQEYLPAFYTNEVILQYSDTKYQNTANGFIIDPTTNFVIGFNGVQDIDIGAPTIYSVLINVPSMYANIPISAMKIKEDFEQGAVSIKYNVFVGENMSSTERTDSFINVLVSPAKLHDLLELPACYSAKPSKSFTNFNRNNTYVFDKTVYRSDVVSDESLVNAFRHFAADNYKNIFENKGKIVNLVGIGLYFLVHTEYSLYVFDRTPKLTAKSQLDIPDTFDIDYQDVMPSNEGFGGLYDKEEAILTKNGYIWFDRVNKFIFRYENGKVSILSVDVNNFLKYIDIIGIRFAEDIVNNRLLICINCLKYVNDKTNPVVPTYITLSYSFNSNSFISLHDYKFTNNYRTYNSSYLFDTANPTKLFEYGKGANKVEYGDLTINEDYFFPYYGVRETDDSSVTGKSYVDIIFNKDYFNVKVIESVHYLLATIQNKIYPYKITEEYLDRRFSGNEIRIYTDETDSGDLDIHVDSSELNDLNNYKFPYFDKGRWNLNYFRNKILEAVTEDEVKKSLGKDTEVTDETKLMARSDNKSLIYGKYIVVRFIFNNDANIKFDGVDITTNNY